MKTINNLIKEALVNGELSLDSARHSPEFRRAVSKPYAAGLSGKRRVKAIREAGDAWEALRADHVARKKAEQRAAEDAVEIPVFEAAHSGGEDKELRWMVRSSQARSERYLSWCAARNYTPLHKYEYEGVSDNLSGHFCD